MAATVAVTVAATTAAEEPPPIVVVTSPISHPIRTKREDEGGTEEDPC